ncbi:hypothetical protein [Leptospira stimsonii]|uniref:Uncharacterized protein n=1 Tax=Leptospira stimsonii TaxID=2202203 RepID=A0A396ZCC3_9LEPT|nr:hypothetical protein [Leptospira stimsonii]RHX90730.1 hypothetical protein DLM75_10090 [Leptospira stimsonii]
MSIFVRNHREADSSLTPFSNENLIREFQDRFSFVSLQVSLKSIFRKTLIHSEFSKDLRMRIFLSLFCIFFMMTLFANCKTKSDSQVASLVEYATVLGETKCECEKVERAKGAESEEVSICLRKLEDAQKRYGVNIRLFPDLANKGEKLIQGSYNKRCPL